MRKLLRLEVGGAGEGAAAGSELLKPQQRLQHTRPLKCPSNNIPSQKTPTHSSGDERAAKSLESRRAEVKPAGHLQPFTLLTVAMETVTDEARLGPFSGDIITPGRPRGGWWTGGTSHLLHGRSFFFGWSLQADGTHAGWFPPTSQRPQQVSLSTPHPLKMCGPLSRRSKTDSRVGGDGHSHHQHLVPLPEEPPQASVVASDVQVPDVEALREQREGRVREGPQLTSSPPQHQQHQQNQRYLSQLRPGGRVRLCVHLNEHDVDLPLSIGQKGVLTRVLGVIQHLCFSGPSHTHTHKHSGWSWHQ